VVDHAGGTSGGIIGNGRPGMTNVVPTTDGKWLMTFEYWGSPSGSWYKVADNPLEFFKATGSRFQGRSSGSPTLHRLPDGRILYNDSGLATIWVNESGASDGSWKQFRTTVSSGYSRSLQYVQGTGRISVARFVWGGRPSSGTATVGPINYGTVDIGYSEGAYYQLINRATGQALGTGAVNQDPDYSGNDVANIRLEVAQPGNPNQLWHIIPKTGVYSKLLHKGGGRAVGLWQGGSSSGTNLTLWGDDDGADKGWQLIDAGDGYYRLESQRNTSLGMTGANAGGNVTNSTVATLGDPAQEWKLVIEPPLLSELNRARDGNLAIPAAAAAGSTVELDAAATEPGALDAKTHADISGHVFAFAESSTGPTDLGTVVFDADERSSVTLPRDLGTGSVKLAVLFDTTALMWDEMTVTEPEPRGLDLDVVASYRCLAGKAYLTVQVTNADDVAVDVDIVTAFGSKAFAAVAPGKSAFHSFTTRLAVLPDGTVSVAASIGSGSAARTANADASYPGASCQ
jgi:hypothetical protein